MFRLIATAIIALAFEQAQAAPTQIQGMYVNTFGNAANQSLIFIHGGPGFNSIDFEITTAPVLAAAGFYVVVYDQRGQGRSDEATIEQFNYRQYADDLKAIIDALHLNRPVLLGHSHGGPIAIHFDQFYPNVARSVVLASAPIFFWDSMRSIFGNCAYRYQVMGATDKLASLSALYQKLFLGPPLENEEAISSISESFAIAGDCGLYFVQQSNSERDRLLTLLASAPMPSRLNGLMTAMPGFFINEHYVHFDGSAHVRQNRDHFCGIYGAEDGLFTPLTRSVLQSLIPKFAVLRGASHAIYIDQQSAFIEALRDTCGVGANSVQ